MGMRRTAVVIVVTAIVLQLLPSYRKRSLPKVSEGFVAPGWEKLEQVFKSQVESGLEKGAGFAVWYKGKLVFDYVGGYADAEAERPYARDTLTLIFSSTKGVSAIATALLVERGLLDYDEPVVKYWPEFGQNGKETVTVRTLLGHSAGLAIIDKPLHFDDLINNPDKVSEALAEQKPAWEPGTNHGYHAFTIAMYMNELIRRVDPKGRHLNQFFREEIAIPYGLDIYIGLPLEEYHRTARTHRATLWSTVECRNWQMFPLYIQMAFGIKSSITKLLGNPRGYSEITLNNPDIRKIPCGSVYGHATASGLAKLYGILANGGSYKGKRLLSEKTIRNMIKIVSAGSDAYLGLNLTYAAGVNVNLEPLDELAFGTPGAGGQLGMGDLKHKMGFAYLTNYMKNSQTMTDPRLAPLRDALYDVIADLESTQP